MVGVCLRQRRQLCLWLAGRDTQPSSDWLVPLAFPPIPFPLLLQHHYSVKNTCVTFIILALARCLFDTSVRVSVLDSLCVLYTVCVYVCVYSSVLSSCFTILVPQDPRGSTSQFKVKYCNYFTILSSVSQRKWRLLKQVMTLWVLYGMPFESEILPYQASAFSDWLNS